MAAFPAFHTAGYQDFFRHQLLQGFIPLTECHLCKGMDESYSARDSAPRNPKILVRGASLYKSHRKNGPPMIAVMTPTGISTGGAMVRANMSHRVKNKPPKSRLAGAKNLWSGPTSNRQICGAMMPIKAMGPQIE